MTTNRNKIETMEENSLNKYLDEIGRGDLLTDEQERELALRIKAGDAKALNKLVETNLRFVVKIASQYRNQGVDFEDLISEGNIGLMKAAAKFDATKGLRFVNFAVVYIREQIEKSLPEKQEECAPVRGAGASLDAPLGHRTNMNLLSVLVNKDASMADERVHSEAIEDAVEYALTSLTDRESRIVNAFYGIGQEHETMSEIAEDMGLKRERVRQIRDKAVRRLRKTFKNKLREIRK